MEQAPVLGAQSHVQSLTNTLSYISLLRTVYDREIYGCLVRQSWLSTNPSGKIPTSNPPTFSNICPRYPRWGIP